MSAGTSLWLSSEELQELTGFTRLSRQRKALAEMGIKFRSRPADGYPLVERAQFETLTKPKRRVEPRWDLMQ